MYMKTWMSREWSDVIYLYKVTKSIGWLILWYRITISQKNQALDILILLQVSVIYWRRKRQSRMTLPSLLLDFVFSSYFLNFSLPNPSSPINPAPKRRMVVGSGTGKEVSSMVMNDLLENEEKFQDSRIPAKRRVPSIGYTLGSAIQTREFLFHRVFSLQTSGACEV